MIAAEREIGLVMRGYADNAPSRTGILVQDGFYAFLYVIVIKAFASAQIAMRQQLVFLSNPRKTYWLMTTRTFAFRVFCVVRKIIAQLTTTFGAYHIHGGILLRSPAEKPNRHTDKNDRDERGHTINKEIDPAPFRRSGVCEQHATNHACDEVVIVIVVTHERVLYHVCSCLKKG